MSLLATSGFAGLLPLLLVLACPLLMIFMMRGMHGRSHGGETTGAKLPRERMSLEELKRERDELNELIGDRAEQEVTTR